MLREVASQPTGDRVVLLAEQARSVAQLRSRIISRSASRTRPERAYLLDEPERAEQERVLPTAEGRASRCCRPGTPTGRYADPTTGRSPPGGCSLAVLRARGRRPIGSDLLGCGFEAEPGRGEVVRQVVPVEQIAADLVAAVDGAADQVR